MDKKRSEIADTIKSIVEGLDNHVDGDVYIILKSVLFIMDYNKLEKNEEAKGHI